MKIWNLSNRESHLVYTRFSWCNRDDHISLSPCSIRAQASRGRNWPSLELPRKKSRPPLKWNYPQRRMPLETAIGILTDETSWMAFSSSKSSMALCNSILFCNVCMVGLFRGLCHLNGLKSDKPKEARRQFSSEQLSSCCWFKPLKTNPERPILGVFKHNSIW